MEPGKDTEQAAIEGLWPLERPLFRRTIHSQARKPDSRFSKNLKRFGPVGAARLMASYLWLTPVWLLVFAIVIVAVLQRSSDPGGSIAPLVVLACGCICIAIMRFVSAIREGRRFRQETSPT